MHDYDNKRLSLVMSLELYEASLLCMFTTLKDCRW